MNVRDNMARMKLRDTAIALTLAGALAACSGSHGVVPATGFQSSAVKAAAHRAGPRATTGCTSYVPYSGGGGVPINFANSSGLTTPVFIYVNAGSQYLNTNGTLTPYPATSVATTYEYPLSCFTGKNAMQFVLPPGNSFRVYFSFGDLTLPSNGIPACCEPNNVPTGFSNPNYNTLWDLIEYSYSSSAGLNIDTTQVDSFAMPFLLSVTAGGTTTTVGTKNYAKIITAMKAAAPWNTLLVNGKVGKVAMPLRVMSPNDATTEVGTSNQPYNPNFPQNYFFSDKYYNPKGSTGTMGYIGALLKYYQDAGTKKNPLYHKIIYVAYQTTFAGQGGCNSSPTGGGATICPTYYASSDGTANFIFTLATNPSSAGTFPLNIKVPVTHLQEYAMINGIWGIPFSLPANPTVKQQIQFYMYKGLAADLNRGVAMQPGYHGVAPCSGAKSPPTGCAQYFTPPVMPSGNNYYHNPTLVGKLPAIFNGYAEILHDNFVNAFTYAQSYDDFWSQSSDIGTASTPTNITLTIEPMKL
jgi:Beta-1,3-glucanase